MKWVRQQAVCTIYGTVQEDDDAEKDAVDPALIAAARTANGRWIGPSVISGGTCQ